MSDSTQQYILKPGVKFADDVSVHGYNKRFKVGEKTGTISSKAFEALFKPLDIPDIEKQLDEIANKTAIRIAHDLQYEERTWDEDRAIVEGYVSNLISELKVLFGLENKETDHGH